MQRRNRKGVRSKVSGFGASAGGVVPELFHYYEQENAGLGAARNAGLRQVKTKMVGFLDSDDWVPTTYIERLTDRIEREGELPDLLYTLPTVFDTATNKFLNWADKSLIDTIFYDDAVVVYPQYDPRILGAEVSACAKLYRVSLLRQHNFSFPEGTKWEDVEPNYQLLHVAGRIIAEKSTGFIYRINTGGQITSSVGRDRLQIVSVFSGLFARAASENWKRVEISYVLRAFFIFTKWSISSCTNNVRKELVPLLHEAYLFISRESLTQFYHDMCLPRKDRMYIWLLRSSFYTLLASPVRYMYAKKRVIKILSIAGIKG